MNGGDDGESDASSAQTKQQAAIFEAMPVDVRRALRSVGLLDRSRNGEAIYMLPFDLPFE